MPVSKDFLRMALPTGWRHKKPSLVGTGDKAHALHTLKAGIVLKPFRPTRRSGQRHPVQSRTATGLKIGFFPHSHRITYSPHTRKHQTAAHKKTRPQKGPRLHNVTIRQHWRG
jgi:hypothetical protein